MTSDLERAASECISYFAHRYGIRRRLAALVGEGVRAQSFDQGVGSTAGTVVFCWFHGDEVTRCHHLGRCAHHLRECKCKTKEPCVGDSVPTTTDMAGDSGIGHDAYRHLLAECDRWERKLSIACHNATPSGIVTRLVLDPPPDARPAAKVFARAIFATAAPTDRPKGLTHDGMPYCDSCRRIKNPRTGEPEWSEPYPGVAQPTNIKGLLPKKYLLCEPCYRRIKSTGHLPTIADLKHRQDDDRGHWPARHTPAKKAS